MLLIGIIPMGIDPYFTTPPAIIGSVITQSTASFQAGLLRHGLGFLGHHALLFLILTPR